MLALLPLTERHRDTAEWPRSSKKTFKPASWSTRLRGEPRSSFSVKPLSTKLMNWPSSAGVGEAVFYIKAEVKGMCKLKPYGEIMMLNKSTANYPS